MLERYQRCTPRLSARIGAVVRELAGRAGACLLSVLAMAVSRPTALRVLSRLPLPGVLGAQAADCFRVVGTGRELL